MVIINDSFKVFEVIVESMADYHRLVGRLPENMNIIDDEILESSIAVYISCDDPDEFRLWLSSLFGLEVFCDDE